MQGGIIPFVLISLFGYNHISTVNSIMMNTLTHVDNYQHMFGSLEDLSDASCNTENWAQKLQNVTRNTE